MNIRQFRWEDLPAIVDLMNEHALALFGQRGQATLEQVEQRWRAPYNHPDRDGFVAHDSNGRIVGYTITDFSDEPHHATGVYQVLPGYPDVSRALIQAATDYFLKSAQTTVVSDVPLTMEWRVYEQETEAITLFESDGFVQVRQFYTMRIALDQPIAPTPLPDGFTLRPFTPDDLVAVYDAKVEMFLDHWGGQHQPLDEWRHDIAVPNFDPSLWWIAVTGDAIAGIVLSQPSSEKTAYVGIVGVLRPWRKRGLAGALLLQCFAEYQRRGFNFVQLGVDSDSSTNAVALYQRVGMSIQRTILYYRKTLRSAQLPSG